MKLRFTGLPFLAGFLLLFTHLMAYSGGPPNGKTGAPGEGTCRDCHNSFGLNSGPGQVTIQGIPEAYYPGDIYTLSVHVNQAGQSRWGFELAAKTVTGSQGGAITVTQPQYTQTSNSGGIIYLKHRSAGTFNGQPGGAVWEFEWTAPEAATGPVTFYTAGNAANGNFDNTGDYIYTTQATSAEGVTCFSDGDVNFDGSLNILDIVTVINFILGTDVPTDEEFCAADVNLDESLNILDIVTMLGMILREDG
ncbi:MAG: hypothetical protein GXO91_05985 [FCB group bacterium]|nr:hypothetical protein [FCB group bacterium]